MGTVRRFEELTVWKMAREQAKEIYILTMKGDFAKDFGLRDQVNKSAGSVMDNIAEGFERFSNKEFLQFLVIAKGSNAEVRSQLYRAYDRNYISHQLLSKHLTSSNAIGIKLKNFIDYLSGSKIKTKPTKTLQPSNIPTL